MRLIMTRVESSHIEISSWVANSDPSFIGRPPNDGVVLCRNPAARPYSELSGDVKWCRDCRAMVYALVLCRRAPPTILKVCHGQHRQIEGLIFVANVDGFCRVGEKKLLVLVSPPPYASAEI